MASVCPALAHEAAHSAWPFPLTPLMIQQAGSITSPTIERGPVAAAFIGADPFALAPAASPFAGSLLFGNFLAPGFFLSLSGAVCSLAVLALSLHLPQRWFGPVTDSVLAAFAHIAGQMAVVYLWLIPHSGIAYLIPIFATAALVFGTVNGLVAARFMDNGDKPEPERQP